MDDWEIPITKILWIVILLCNFSNLISKWLFLLITVTSALCDDGRVLAIYPRQRSLLVFQSRTPISCLQTLSIIC